MGKGFGIAALVLAIVAIFVPLYGIYISAIAVLLAVIAGFSGDNAFPIATSLIAGVNTFFLSPALIPAFQERPEMRWIVIAALAAPVVAVVIHSMARRSA